jgi:hypothetical protein
LKHLLEFDILRIACLARDLVPDPCFSDAKRPVNTTQCVCAELVRELQVLFDGLQARFPGRVTFTTQLEGARASSTRFLVWGAHARNWNLQDGIFIPGGGQAAAMGRQKRGIFGIITTPLPLGAVAMLALG